MAHAQKAYVEHVAIRVKDIDWHVRSSVMCWA